MSDDDDEEAQRRPVPRVVSARRMSPETAFKREVAVLADLVWIERSSPDEEISAEIKIVGDNGVTQVLRLTLSSEPGVLQ